MKQLTPIETKLMVETRPTTLTYEDYLNTSDDERWELLRGELTMAPSPEFDHQKIAGRLFSYIDSFVDENDLGDVVIAPFDVVLSHTNVLQPDVLFVSREQNSIITAKNIQGAPALVIEVLSPSSLTRDRELKRAVYAEHGVGEYWIVDPDARTISVLSLDGKEFRDVGRYSASDTLSSPTLPGLALDPASIFPSS